MSEICFLQLQDVIYTVFLSNANICLIWMKMIARPKLISISKVLPLALFGQWRRRETMTWPTNCVLNGIRGLVDWCDDRTVFWVFWGITLAMVHKYTYIIALAMVHKCTCTFNRRTYFAWHGISVEQKCFSFFLQFFCSVFCVLQACAINFWSRVIVV